VRDWKLLQIYIKWNELVIYYLWNTFDASNVIA
jgi:hypothetical protein